MLIKSPGFNVAMNSTWLICWFKMLPALKIALAFAGDPALGTMLTVIVRAPPLLFQYQMVGASTRLSAAGKPISDTVLPAGTVNKVLAPLLSDKRRASNIGTVASNSTT